MRGRLQQPLSVWIYDAVRGLIRFCLEIKLILFIFVT